MGQFANTLFRVLLGWVQTAVSWLWNLTTNADVSSWFRWVLHNWLPLTLILCGAGLLVDFLVYLLRWQPYRVWRRFLRRMNGKDDEPQCGEDAQQQFQRQWVYADGTTSIVDLRNTAQQEYPGIGSDHLELPIRPVRRVARHLPREQAYYQPVYPPQWQNKTMDDQGENE